MRYVPKNKFLRLTLELFPENLDTDSDESGEYFHQEISNMEKQDQGKWSASKLTDYCWTLTGMLHRWNSVENQAKSLFR